MTGEGLPREKLVAAILQCQENFATRESTRQCTALRGSEHAFPPEVAEHDADVDDRPEQHQGLRQ
jgi:hypothetical protein